MFSTFWEFLFCPQHGLFAPANWAFILPAATGGMLYFRRIWGRLWLRLATMRYMKLW